MKQDGGDENSSAGRRPKRKRIYRSELVTRRSSEAADSYQEGAVFNQPASYKKQEDRPYPVSRGYEKYPKKQFAGKKPFQDRKKPTGKKSFKPVASKEDYKKKKQFAPPASQSYERKKNDELIRLNKYISNSGICSRREADKLITAGLVSVNGEIITSLGTKIKAGDVVKYNNELVKNERLVYVLLNKPKDFITTMDDPEQRNTVMDLVATACRERIYPVGRLDRNTTGLLLFTNDGELAKQLTHPSTEIKKIYHVELDKKLKPADLEHIQKGVDLEDGIAYVDDIAYDAAFGDKSQVGIELHSGKNRVVRRIFEQLGYNVIKLDRVVFAGLTKKDLPRGRYRFLTDAEVNMLKMTTSAKPARKKKKQE